MKNSWIDLLITTLFTVACILALDSKWQIDELEKNLTSICGEVQKLDLLVVDKEGVCG